MQDDAGTRQAGRFERGGISLYTLQIPIQGDTECRTELDQQFTLLAPPRGPALPSAEPSGGRGWS